MMQFIKFEKEVFRDFRNIEAKRRIKQVNQQIAGIERQGTDCFVGLLCGNGEEAEHDTLESSL